MSVSSLKKIIFLCMFVAMLIMPVLGDYYFNPADDPSPLAGTPHYCNSTTYPQWAGYVTGDLGTQFYYCVPVYVGETVDDPSVSYGLGLMGIPSGSYPLCILGYLNDGSSGWVSAGDWNNIPYTWSASSPSTLNCPYYYPGTSSPPAYIHYGGYLVKYVVLPGSRPPTVPTLHLTVSPTSGLVTTSYILTANVSTGFNITSESFGYLDNNNVSHIIDTYKNPTLNPISDVLNYPTGYSFLTNQTVWASVTTNTSNTVTAYAYISSQGMNNNLNKVNIIVNDAVTGYGINGATVSEGRFPPVGDSLFGTGLEYWKNVTGNSPFSFTTTDGGNRTIQPHDSLSYYATAPGYQYVWLSQALGYGSAETYQFIGDGYGNTYTQTLTLLPNGLAANASLGQFYMLVSTTCDVGTVGQITVTDQSTGVSITQNMSYGGTSLFYNLTAGDRFGLTVIASGYQTAISNIQTSSGFAGTTFDYLVTVLKIGYVGDVYYNATNFNTTVTIGVNGEGLPVWNIPVEWTNISSPSLTLPSVTGFGTTINVNNPMTAPAWQGIKSVPSNLPDLPYNYTTMYTNIITVIPASASYLQLTDSILGFVFGAAHILTMLILYPIILITQIIAWITGMIIGLLNGFLYALAPFLYAMNLISNAFPTKIQAVVVFGLLVNLFRSLYSHLVLSVKYNARTGK